MDIAELKIACDSTSVQAATETLNLLADAASRAKKALEELHDAAAGRHIEIEIVGSCAAVTIDGVLQAA